MSGELARRIAAEHAAAVDSLPASVVARARRGRAIDALIAGGLPTPRDENWRYANLRPLERVRFTPSPAQAELSPGALPPPLPGYARYVFVDGVMAAALSHPVTPRPGVTVYAPSRALHTRDAASAFGTSDAAVAPAAERVASLWAAGEAAEPSSDAAFTLLNDAFALDCAHIEVTAEEAILAEPACIEVVFVASAPAQRGASYPRMRVTAAPRARLRLVERHASLGGEAGEVGQASQTSQAGHTGHDGEARQAGEAGHEDRASDASFVDCAVEVLVGAGAEIDHYRVQQLGARAVCMDTLAASVGRSAVYRLHAIGLGAQSARSSLRIGLDGDGAELALHAVAVGSGQQVLDTHAIVTHTAAHTRTEETFRGIAAGRSRVAFNGKIIVQPGARGADSTQSLRGLLEGATAEVDVRPQLEIYTDEVRCSHGATTGKLDETMLFYLLSRGLDRGTAQRLLEWAFLEDVVSRIRVAELRRKIELSLAGRMRDSDALKELL